MSSKSSIPRRKKNGKRSTCDTDPQETDQTQQDKASGAGSEFNSTPQDVEAHSADGCVVITVGDDKLSCDPTELLNDDEYHDELKERCTAGSEPPVFDLGKLLDLDDEPRWRLLDFVDAVSGNCHATIQGNIEQYPSLFDCVLALLVDDQDTTRCGRGRRAAIEAAALVHPTERTEACSRIAKRLQKLKVTGFKVNDLVTEVTNLLSGLDNEDCEDDEFGIEEELGTPVREALPESPVAESVKVPSGWVLGEDGIKKTSGDDAYLVVPHPVIMTARFSDVNTNEESVELAWYRDGDWQSVVAKRREIANTRLIVELAAHGLPVTSNNARDLVQWLADFEHTNLDVLPRASVATQLGWHGNEGSEGFLLGDRFIDADGEFVESAAGKPVAEQSSRKLILFQGADEGDKQLADGFHAKGSIEGWTSAVALVANHLRVLLAVYAAFVPVLLRLFGVQNFLIDYCGDSSIGKTTTLRAAAGVWGCPDEYEPLAAIFTWNSSRIWAERAMGVLNYLPFVVDDTKQANREDVSKIIYDVANGRGRGRGTVRGTARTATFRTVMLLSGEVSATSFTHDGGTKARVMTIWGPPFEARNAETAKLIQAFNSGIKSNYGHAGPEFVQYLLRNREQWTEWQRLYADELANYQELAGDNPIAQRLAPMFTVIGMAAWLVHQAFELPWEYADPAKSMWDELVGEAGEADVAKAALQYTYEYACAHQGQFYRLQASSPNKPNTGWIGRWDSCHKPAKNDKDDAAVYTTLDFIPQMLRDILSNAGFEAEAVFRTWDERDWLQKETASGNARPKRRIDSADCRVIAIKREAIKALDKNESEEKADEEVDQDPDGDDGDDGNDPDEEEAVVVHDYDCVRERRAQIVVAEVE